MSRMALEMLISNVFVVLPESTDDGSLLVGKNSRKPSTEIQEVKYFPGGVREGDKIKCTYINIDNCPEPINSIIVSKPAWMWGAEMGSNDKNVFVTRESTLSECSSGDFNPDVKRLTGADLVRLGLERGSSAENTLDIITDLLEKYGQGGPSTLVSDLGSQNIFVIADSKEAWVLETAGKFWVAEKLKQPRTAISNIYSIRTTFDKSTENIQERAKDLSLWDGREEFDFSRSFGLDDNQVIGENILRDVKTASFSINDMFEVLRDDVFIDNQTANYYIQSSQVSQLNDSTVSVHWFTGTPNSKKSIFKPFIFTPNVKISKHIICPTEEDCSSSKPHNLYALHQKKIDNEAIREILRKLEGACVSEVSIFRQDFTKGEVTLEEVDDLMKDSVDAEVNYYR